MDLTNFLAIPKTVCVLMIRLSFYLSHSPIEILHRTCTVFIKMCAFIWNHVHMYVCMYGM